MASVNLLRRSLDVTWKDEKLTKPADNKDTTVFGLRSCLQCSNYVREFAILLPCTVNQGTPETFSLMIHFEKKTSKYKKGQPLEVEDSSAGKISRVFDISAN
ncbi:hypothetical protein BaRGS_00010534 [Batillaria attramentaria]|uniref:Uncharacterized protein n=1 Tax=Batillaria attramentaria TaxID=370345 RepID=A0ABD0LFP7_9CAEN